jgi:hypothetical protein
MLRENWSSTMTSARRPAGCVRQALSSPARCCAMDRRKAFAHELIERRIRFPPLRRLDLLEPEAQYRGRVHCFSQSILPEQGSTCGARSFEYPKCDMPSNVSRPA